MPDPSDLFGYAALLALLVVAAGCWTLHRRMRNRQTLALLLSFLSLLIWLPVSTFLTTILLSNGDTRNPSALLNYSYLAIDVVIPALLLVAAAILFLQAVRTIPPRSSSIGAN